MSLVIFSTLRPYLLAYLIKRGLITNDGFWHTEKKSLQNKDGVCSTRIEKYLWTSKTFLRLYIYIRDRYVESHGHYRHVFHDRSSRVIDR